MDYLSFLYGLKREGIKLGLEVMSDLVDRLGNPQNSFKSVHIAGTNGKGSTAAIIYNILKQKFKTGLYTSPHLVKFNERILVQDEFIDDEFLVNFVKENLEIFTELSKINRNPTFFEATTAMAFAYFQNRKCDFASVEVGLGGRLDSTNVITPEVSIITAVGYEHSDKLGTSLESIAFEKGGIIKPGVPVVLGDTKLPVFNTIRKLCSLRKCVLRTAINDAKVKDLKVSKDGTEFTLETGTGVYEIASPMVGTFQPSNIVSAVLAVELLQDHGLTAEHIIKGVKNTVWPARMEVISRSPFVMVDAAHNPPAVHALVNSYSTLFSEKPHLLVGMLRDKDYYTFLMVLSRLSDTITITTPDEPQRSISPYKLQPIAEKFFKNVKIIEDPREAYIKLRALGEPMLVTGSIYLVGIIKEIEHSPITPYISSYFKRQD